MFSPEELADEAYGPEEEKKSPFGSDEKAPRAIVAAVRKMRIAMAESDDEAAAKFLKIAIKECTSEY